MEDIIYYFQQKLIKKNVIKRKKYFSVLENDVFSKPIKIALGARRVGKTSFFVNLIQESIKKGDINIQNIFYLNFEDNVLLKYSSIDDLQKLYDVFITKIKKPGRTIIFLDEIQNVDLRESFVRARYDEDENFIFITGSNSKLLSNEIATSLSGRTIPIEIYPLDFKEFIQFYQNFHNEKEKSVNFLGKIDDNNFYKRNKQEILILFNQYLKFGGFPETIMIYSEEAKKSYLKSIFSKVLLDDVIQRYNIRNIQKIKQIAIYLFSFVTKQISYNNLQKILVNKGYKISYETIIDYIFYFQNTFLVSLLHKFDPKLQRIFDGSKKVYSLDNGLIGALQENIVEFDSVYIENLMYNILKQEYKNIYFYTNNNKEIDFIGEKDNLFDAIQVTYKINDGNTNREIGNFIYLKNIKSINSFKLFVIEGETKIIDYKDMQIEQINIVEYLLSI